MYQDIKKLQRCLNSNKPFVNKLMDDGYILVSAPNLIFFATARDYWEYNGCAGSPNNFFLTEEDIDYAMNGVD